MATSFLALYRGDSVSTAKLLALTVEPELVRDFAAKMLQNGTEAEEPDEVLRELEDGRCRALRLVEVSE